MFRGGPPSTPGRNSYDSQKFWESQNAPSTTPAGPPPDKSAYPTLGGAPPTMNKGLFSTSRPTFDKPNSYGFGATSLFGSSPPKPSLYEGVGSGSMGTSTLGRPPVQRGRPTSGTFRVPSASSDDGLNRDAEGDSDDEDHYMDNRHRDDDEDSEQDPPSASRRNKTQSRLAQSVVSMTSANDVESSPALVRPGAKQTQFDLLALAKGLASNKGRSTLQESDEVILETERLIEKAMESLHSDTPAQRTDVLGEVAQELITTWQAASKSNLRASMTASRSESATDILHATRLASLLLTLHHPPQVDLTQRASALSLVPARPESKHYTPIPRILLNWLNSTFSGVSEVDDVLKQSRGYSQHPSYWEAVHITVVRGNFSQTLKLLQGAQLEHAETAELDGLGSAGYTGKHLQYANHAVRQALDLLHECPAIASDDWDIKGHDWAIFRQRVQQTYADLEEFSEGESASRHAMSQSFQAAHFGISQTQASFQLSVASRKAESKVPWSIYENLGKLYQLLLGNEQEILELSADWIEAVIGLGVWWNGEEEDQTQGSLAASRRSILRSQRVRPVDVTPIKAYCQRLSASLAAVIQNSDEDFGVNVVDRFEVGVACILDDNMEGALQILQGWSLTIATAVAELASVGEWFSSAKGLMDQFDQSDLMVLSYTEQQEPKGVTKDDLLVTYSTLLASKGQLTDREGQVSKEGWEIAVQILGRLDDTIAANERIERILNDLPLESSARVDKITQLCHDLGLSQHAVTIAQVKYRGKLRETKLTVIEIRRSSSCKYRELWRDTPLLRPRSRCAKDPRGASRSCRPLPSQVNSLPTPRRTR